MIDVTLYLAFIAAASTLILIPGPNVAMIVANSVAYGARFGILTVAGTSAAMLLQLVATCLGLGTALDTFGTWFEWLRWLGVAYLVVLGILAWRAVPADLSAARPQTRSVREIVLRGFFVSLTNPKTLLFYGAFFPQFVSPDHPARPQILLLSATFLTIAVALDVGWALAASRARPLLLRRGRLRNRVTGGLLIGAGAGLALARRR